MNNRISIARLMLIGSLLSLCGCSHAPLFNLLGSYFPSWIVCFTGGVIVTFLSHTLFVRLRLTQQLWPLPIVYPALTCLVTCGLWLACFS